MSIIVEQCDVCGLPLASASQVGQFRLITCEGGIECFRRGFHAVSALAAERGVALDMATDNCIRLAAANTELGSVMMDADIVRGRLAKAIGIDIPSEDTMPLDDLADTVVAHIEAMHEERAELWRDLRAEQERRIALPFQHEDGSECPTFYDGCNCSLEVLRDQIGRAERAEAQLAVVYAQRDAAQAQAFKLMAEVDEWRATAEQAILRYGEEEHAKATVIAERDAANVIIEALRVDVRETRAERDT